MAGDNKLIPVLEMWQKYPDDVKELVSNPLAAAVKALKAANVNDDWREIEAATKLLEFLAEELYQEE